MMAGWASDGSFLLRKAGDLHEVLATGTVKHEMCVPDVARDEIARKQVDRARASPARLLLHPKEVLYGGLTSTFQASGPVVLAHLILHIGNDLLGLMLETTPIKRVEFLPNDPNRHRIDIAPDDIAA